MTSQRLAAVLPWFIAVFIIVTDQWTKQVIRYTFALGESRPIVPGFFDLTYVRNSGAAWGMFHDHGIVLIGVSVVMLAMMLIFHRSFITPAWEHRMAFGLLLGGIVGNLMDRIRLQAVTDFLDFYIGSHHWPSFNIADSAICIGVTVYIFSAYWLHEHPLHEPKKVPEAGEEEPPESVEA